MRRRPFWRGLVHVHLSLQDVFVLAIAAVVIGVPVIIFGVIALFILGMVL